MRIKNIELYKGKTYSVEFENGDKIFLHADIVSDFALKNGMDLSEEKLAEIQYQSDKRKAYQRALYLLDYKDYSYVEMFKKLNKTYTNEDLCYEIMDKLCEYGLINDRRYAENFARKLIEVKKYGAYKARFEMQKKGLDKELIEEMLEKYEDDVYERLSELIEKKYARYLTDFKGIQKVKSALVRKGYSFDDINEVIDEYIDK